MIASSLAEMESRYNKALERTVMLEEELVAKARLEDDNQRLRDELQGESRVAAYSLPH
jgi:nuclear distribution protein NudE